MTKKNLTPTITPPRLTFISNVKLACVALAATCGVCFSGCDDYDDTELWNTVRDHEQRLAALEEWQAEVNNNISALQTLINTNDMITSVTPITMGDAVTGYTISFLHSAPITIYNGKDGEKGETGAVPQIGLTQDEAGDWYWTLNGSLMLDADGNPIRANGEDGKDGQDGEDGADGEDGNDGSTGATGPAGKPAPTPKISLGSAIEGGTIITDSGTKIAEAWYLSIDNGASWHRVSGMDGDSFFAEAPKLSDDKTHYIFTLSDNTEIKVPVYQEISITFGTDITQEIGVNNSLEIKYEASENIRVTALPVQSDWKAEVSETVITVTAGQEHTECDLIIIATDNKGNSVSYTLRLGKYDYDEGTKTYTVYNAAGLLAWNEAVQEDLSLNCTLNADIDLTGMSWGLIGSNANGSSTTDDYQGTFDGQGHRITGLSITTSSSTNEPASLINSIGNNGKVKNLQLVDVTLTVQQERSIGAIAVYNYGNITACSATGTVTSQEGHAGGLVSQNLGSITACWFDGTSNGREGRAKAGIAGVNLSNAAITSCYYSGNVTSGVYVNLEGSVNATKVDGETTTWSSAVTAMNNALSDNDYQWQSDSGQPTLSKKVTN